MKFTGYMAWILICKHCKFGEKICYNSGDIEFFLGDYFFLARPVYWWHYVTHWPTQLSWHPFEYENICFWSFQNRLSINTDKTKQKKLFFTGLLLGISIFPLLWQILNEILRLLYLEKKWYDPYSIHFNICKRDAYANKSTPILTVAAQVLHILLTGLIMSNIAYTLPAFADQLSADDINRTNAISRKALHRGVTHTASNIEEIIDSADRKLFNRITQPGHCLYHLLSLKTYA